MQILKLTLAFLSSHFPTTPKGQGKNLNILRTKRDINMKQKALVIIFKWFWAAKNCLTQEWAFRVVVDYFN